MAKLKDVIAEFKSKKSKSKKKTALDWRQKKKGYA